MADVRGVEFEAARGLARRLRSALAEIDRTIEIESATENDWRAWSESVHRDQRFQQIVEIVEKLEKALRDTNFEPMATETGVVPDEHWSIGTMIYVLPKRPIHAGFVEPRFRLPILTRVPQNVIEFLIRLPGDRDFLEREHHGHIGWHYHYLDAKKRRSNVVLCWDTHVPFHRQNPTSTSSGKSRRRKGAISSAARFVGTDKKTIDACRMRTRSFLSEAARIPLRVQEIRTYLAALSLQK